MVSNTYLAVRLIAYITVVAALIVWVEHEEAPTTAVTPPAYSEPLGKRMDADQCWFTEKRMLRWVWERGGVLIGENEGAAYPKPNNGQLSMVAEMTYTWKLHDDSIVRISSRTRFLELGKFTDYCRIVEYTL